MKTKMTTLLMILLTAVPMMGQLTVEGRLICGPDVSAIITYDNGQTSALPIKGKKMKYSIQFLQANKNYLLTFNAGGVERKVHVHTHQADGTMIKQWVELNIRYTDDMPTESVVYYSPSQNSYVWNDAITPEDIARLAELKLWPLQIIGKP